MLIFANCGDRYAFLVINIGEIPESTVSINVRTEIGSLTSDETWTGKPAQVSQWLPAGTIYWDPEEKILKGVPIRVQVYARDETCIIASGEGQFTAMYQSRQEVSVSLSANRVCTSTPPM